ncbi:transketolase [Atopobiaceae bacterium 24-176]
MQAEELERVTTLAAKIRRDVLEMLLPLGSGHLGGSFSIADLMALLYGKELAFDPENPRWEGRDRVVLSKGHAGPAWYAALAESGFFDREMLFTLNQGGTDLPSHPDRLKTPGVDMTTGSLGQGCSTAAGIAYANRLKGSDAYTYLIVGDGELNEGQCWEAFQFIAHNRLNRCIVIIDDNKKQLDGYTADVMNPFDIAEKMRAFGFYTQRVNGQDVVALDAAITCAKHVEDSAVAIVMDTVKGAGVPYFEQLMSNHSVKFDAEAKAAAETAIAELEAVIEGSRA